MCCSGTKACSPVDYYYSYWQPLALHLHKLANPPWLPLNPLNYHGIQDGILRLQPGWWKSLQLNEYCDKLSFELKDSYNLSTMSPACQQVYKIVGLSWARLWGTNQAQWKNRRSRSARGDESTQSSTPLPPNHMDSERINHNLQLYPLNNSWWNFIHR